MPCAKEHQLGVGLTIGLVIAIHETKDGEGTAWPLFGGLFAAYCARLPDIIEPATSPHHRQFFHSVLFAAVLAYLGYRLYKWEPKEPWQKVARIVALIAIGAYLVHLLQDACTTMSLPLVGKLAA